MKHPSMLAEPAGLLFAAAPAFAQDVATVKVAESSDRTMANALR